MTRRGFPLPDIIDPAGRKCVRVNVPDDPAHLAAFWGQLWRLTYWDVWDRDPDKRGKDAARVWRNVFEDARASIDCATEGQEMMLRQNPDNACQLEYSRDDGVTWSLAFDYGLCVTPAQRVLTDAALRTIAAAGSPFAPPVSWGSSVFDESAADRQIRQDALCYAVSLVVDMTAEVFERRLQDNIDYINLTASILTIIALLLPVAIATIPAIAVLAIVIGTAVLVLFSAILSAQPDLDFTPAIRQYLRCVLYQALVGRGVSESTFLAAFDGATCGSASEQAAAGAMRSLFRSPVGSELYRGFVAAVGELYGAKKAGVEIPACSTCVPREWCYAWRGKNVLADWELVPSSTGSGILALNALEFGRSSSVTGPQVLHFRDKGLLIPAGTTVTGLQINHFRADTTANPGPNTSSVQGRQETFGISGGNKSWNVGPGPLNASFRYTIPNWAPGRQPPGIILRWVLMRGTGVPPFGVCDNCEIINE